MKFDVVIGNPPYQAIKKDGSRLDQASNLWSEFWVRCIEEYSTDHGVVSLITPTSWLSPSSDYKRKRLWDIFNSYTSYADVKNVAKHFNVGSTFGYVVVDKSNSAGLSFSDS